MENFLLCHGGAAIFELVGIAPSTAAILRIRNYRWLPVRIFWFYFEII